MVNSDIEQYRLFLENLQHEDIRPAALNDIKNLLAFKPVKEASDVIRGAGIAEIVHCLDVQDTIQVDLTCEVLSLCFEKFEVGGIIRKFTGHVMYLLRHEKSCVRKLAVDEIAKALYTDPALLPVPEYIDVFVAVGQMVADKDIGVANKAILITCHLPIEAYPKVLDEMLIALEYNASSKCNAFEVIITISSKSIELLQLCSDLGYMAKLVSELRSEDVLYQLNILELMSRLAITPHGISYFARQGDLQKVSDAVAALQKNPLRGLLVPGYMKFFGTIAHSYPNEVFHKYPVLMNLMFDTFDSQDPATLPIALDTLGFIGATIEGKLSLAALGSQYTKAIEKLVQMITNGKTEIKVRAFHCFAALIAVDADPKAPLPRPVDHRVTLMTREWFRALGTRPPPMVLLLETCELPFPDIRAAGFALLDAVCQHQWGEELVATTAGFVEFLLDHTTSSKEVKEVKYDIVKRLSLSAAFSEEVIIRMQKYVALGPFYVEPQVQVSTEEGD